MKNRNKQREKRRLYGKSTEKPWRNAEGYMDLTAYEGIKRAEAGKKNTGEKKRTPRGRLNHYNPAYRATARGLLRKKSEIKRVIAPRSERR